MKLAVFTLVLMLFGGCEGLAQGPRLGEPFTLKNNQSARVRSANLEITVTRIGRKWLANGGGESLDFSFTVKHDGKTDVFSNPLGDAVTIGDYKIQIVKTEPFGEGYATFLVTKNEDAAQVPPAEIKDPNFEEAAKFVENFGWHLEETVPPTVVPLEFPATFDGLPFHHYQAASLASGIDMTPLLGKKVEMLKYTLKEKQRSREGEITYYAHLIVENGRVAGAWRTDSGDSAPGIYSFVRSK